MTLRKKILLVITMLLSLMLAAIFFVIHTWKSSLREGLEGQAQTVLSQQSSILSEEILNGRRMLRVLALDKSFSGLEIGIIRSRLHQWTEEKTQFESFYFDNMTGTVYPPSGPSFSVRDRDYFPSILAGEEIIGTPIISRHTGKPVLLLTAPVKDLNGRIKGALAGTLIIHDIIVRATSGASLDAGAKMFLLDTQGRLLGSTDAGSNSELMEVAREKSPTVFALQDTLLKVKNPAAGDVTKTEILVDDNKFLVHFIFIPVLNWHLVHVQSVRQLLAPANKASAVSFIIIAILILLCAGIFLVLERMIILPVERLRDAHLKLESGDMSVRVAGEGHDELSDLARAFNRSVISLEHSEQKFRTIFEAFPYPIVLNRLSDGIYTGINSAAENYFISIHRDPIIPGSKNNIANIDPEAQKKLLADKQLDNEPFKVTRPDGSEIWIIYSTRLITIAGEQVAMTVLTDVTGLKQTEEALRNSESKARAILDQSFQFMGLLTIDGTLIDVNRSAIEMAGVPESSVLNKPFWECPWWTHSAELQDRLRAAIRTAAAGEPVRFEATNQSADGTLHYVDCSIKPAMDEEGNIIFLIPEGHDITERKRTEDAFLESRNLLQAVLDTIPVRVFWKDLNLKYLGCNMSFALDAGKDNPAALTGKDDYQMPWREQAELYRFDDLDVISSGKAKINFEELQTTTNGDTLWLLTSKIPLIDARNEIYGVLGIYEDITERKLAEEKLRAGEENYRLLFQHNPAPMLIYESGSLQLLAVNDAFESHYGYTSAEIQKMRLTDLYPDDEKEPIAALASDLVRKGHAYAGEWHHCKRDGTIINIEARSHSITYDGHSGRIAVISDITERKRAENKILELNTTLELKVLERTNQLEMANEELDATNQSLLESNENLTGTLQELKSTQEKLVLSSKMAVLGQLIAGIAHEMNTPLGAILSANTMVNDSIIRYLKETFDFYRQADADSIKLFENLIKISLNSDPLKYSSSEHRKRKKELLSIANEHQLVDMDHSIESLLEIGFHGDAAELIQIIQNKNSQKIIDYTHTLSAIINSSSIIKTAAEKISRVVFALKIYAYHDNESKKVFTDIAEEIELVLAIYYNRYKYGVEINRKYNQVPGVYVYAERLNQVWVNLINNALQAMQYNGKLEIAISEEPEKIIVSFTDNGPGIPFDIQDKIFTPFFTTKVIGEGTGLGLDICRKILQEIDGEIGFRSEPGQTVFTVTLKKTEIREGE